MSLKDWAHYLRLHGALLKDIYIIHNPSLFSRHADEFYALEAKIINHEKMYESLGMTLGKRIKIYHQLIPKDFSGVLADIGCAEGLLADAFPFAKYVGVDASKENIKKATEKREGKKFVWGNATEIPLPNNSVDALVCFNMLEHMPEPRKALAEFNRVLADDSYCVLSVPNVMGELISPGHVVFWRRRKWENVFMGYFVIDDYRKQNLFGIVINEHVYKLKKRS